MSRSLRFCMITTFYPPYSFGGDGLFVQQLSNELAIRGHSVDVIHCIDSYRLLTRRKPEKAKNEHPNITVHGLESSVGFLSPIITHQIGSPIFNSTRIRKVLEKGFDVIHYHNISLVGGPKILKYGKGVKLYTMHEYWLVCPTHVMFRFNRKAGFRPKCLPCILSYRRPPQLWRHLGLLNASLRHVDALISPSRFCKQMHRRMGLNATVVHLPNFIFPPDSDLVASDKPLDSLPDDPYFLFVGRLEKLKGLQTLIPVFQRYHKARLLIAGTGNYGPCLCRKSGGSENIRFLGHLTGGQLNHIYRNATALIVPSLCFENFPLVVLEAFRQQTPVIVRNLGGMPELIRESGGGFVYDTDDELVAAMNRLLADAAHRGDLGRRGYQAYKSKWTAEAYLESYFDLILANKPGASHPVASST